MSNNPPDKIVAQHEDVEKISSDANKGVWKRFGKIKGEFLQHLARDYRDELVAAGISPSQIRQMENGRSPNQGNESDPWMIHHTTPRTVSGKLKNPNDYSNLCLIKKSSEQVLHHFIDPQYAHLSPGQSCNILMVRPSGEFCGLNEKETARQLKEAILNPEENNSHAPENQGQGGHRSNRGNRAEPAPSESFQQREESAPQAEVGGEESGGESESPRHSSRKHKHKKGRNKRHHNKYEQGGHGGRESFYSMSEGRGHDHGHGMKGG
jgi:hypothetical protein